MTGRIDIWTDGSGTYETGPACIGVVMLVDDVEACEVSAYVGEGTNNYAELRAIRRGLDLACQLGALDVPTMVHSDSEYAIGVLTKGWSTGAHPKLIAAIHRQMRAFRALDFVHVDGHAGIHYNEVADWLAGRARNAHLRAQGLERRDKRRPEYVPF